MAELRRWVISFVVIVTAVSTITARDCSEKDELIVSLEKRLAEVELRLQRIEEESNSEKDECPCDLSKLGFTYAIFFSNTNTSRIFFLENNIKENAEDITSNTVSIASLRSDVDEAVQQTNDLSDFVSIADGKINANIGVKA